MKRTTLQWAFVVAVAIAGSIAIVHRTIWRSESSSNPLARLRGANVHQLGAIARAASEHSSVRYAALEMLSDIGDPAAIAETDLIAILDSDDADPGLRWRAIWALGAVNPRSHRLCATMDDGALGCFARAAILRSGTSNCPLQPTVAGCGISDQFPSGVWKTKSGVAMHIDAEPPALSESGTAIVMFTISLVNISGGPLSVTMPAADPRQIPAQFVNNRGEPLRSSARAVGHWLATSTNFAINAGEWKSIRVPMAFATISSALSPDAAERLCPSCDAEQVIALWGTRVVLCESSTLVIEIEVRATIDGEAATFALHTPVEVPALR